MPKINIYEADDTGSTYLGDEIVVFVPGDCTIKEGKADSHNCVLVPEHSNVDDYLTKGSDRSYAYVEMLLNKAFQVLYYSGTVNADLFTKDWLKDKNEYNIKYLTTGCVGSLTPTVSTSAGASQNASTKLKVQAASAAENAAEEMIELAYQRKDCIALIDITPDISDLKYTDLQTAINGLEDKDQGLRLSYGACFADWGYINEKDKIKMPGSYFYLDALGSAINNGQKWDSIAGVKRGVVTSYIKPVTMALSKYDLDNNVMPANYGSAFNGIVNVRPYGYTIWGDRTLRKNNAADGLKATSFLSIRVLVCDICKRVYNAAINNTFESNSDVTWANYKTLISELLDQMVADYKLADYKIIKLTPDRASQIKCQIRLVPLEPVEDFDIYIQLENATANITEG